MNLKKTALLAAALAGVLSANAAVVVDSLATEGEFTAPTPVKIVAPANLPRRYMNETVRISVTIDADGRAHDLNLARGRDSVLAQHLLPAVAQWQFKPALRQGRPVAAKVVLPLELVESARG